MGCASSSERKVDNLKSGARSPRDFSDCPAVYVYQSEKSPHLAFNFLIAGVQNFSCSCGMVPSVCLNERAFPIITAKLTLGQDELNETENLDSNLNNLNGLQNLTSKNETQIENNDSEFNHDKNNINENNVNDIELPVFSAAFYGQGRVICFPHIGIIEEICEKVSTTGNFFVNSLSWLAHQKSTMTPICLLGFPQDFIGVSTSALHNFGFFVESRTKAQNLENFKVILVASTFEVENDDNLKNLQDFVSNGGGLAVFFTPADAENPLSFPINPLLSIFGLSYTFCSISENDEIYDIQDDFELLKNQHFDYYLSLIKDLLKNPNKITQAELDQVVTKIRYHAIVCTTSDNEQQKKLKDLGKTCLDYLFSTDVLKNNLFCDSESSDFQTIVLVMLQDILPKYPPEEYKALAGYEIFPGRCEVTPEDFVNDFKMTLTVYDEAWMSTGLYLPAGCVGIIESDKVYDDIKFQVGAHHETLMQKTPPWKRWPSIILPFEMNEKVTKLGSPFGGPVYVSTSDDFEGSITATLTFKGFVKYPRWVYNDLSVWEETKDNKVPLGEIECENLILTIPSEKMKDFDFSKINIVVKGIANNISSFMSYPLEKPFRVVFDIDLPEETPVCGYPIVIKIDEIQNMFSNVDEPSIELFNLASLMAILTIREGCFDSTIESALASISSSIAFSNFFESFEPLSFPNLMLPPLFKELWEIYNNYDKSIIPKTLKKFQDPSYELLGVPEDTWIEFVREMCRIGETDFTKILERSRPIPLNVSMSCQGLTLAKSEMINSSRLPAESP
ncbi:hypothetical protein TRFO_42680 [Tritrichomonas foetus]|uniref:Peptidase M60 domain-containing protein n=1 Tax=Tritrichomonas foetus TaxID=1144522 RepID=A0A1J4KZN1_9EUKA|nr:hypothetical protein TRFO_42680 [Tritrichomonas foetus]|eukprot:OHT15148.1 hypothetical protein TRFO_42680 [Tritrichomonas foetus]